MDNQRALATMHDPENNDPITCFKVIFFTDNRGMTIIEDLRYYLIPSIIQNCKYKKYHTHFKIYYFKKKAIWEARKTRRIIVIIIVMSTRKNSKHFKKLFINLPVSL